MYLLARRKYREEADRRVRELDQDFEQAIQETETRVRSKVSNQVAMATGQGGLNLISSFLSGLATPGGLAGCNTYVCNVQ